MGPIVRLIRWLWRHTSRTQPVVRYSIECSRGEVRIQAVEVSERVVEFCSSPTCGCGRTKRVAPPLAIARRR